MLILLPFRHGDTSQNLFAGVAPRKSDWITGSPVRVIILLLSNTEAMRPALGIPSSSPPTPAQPIPAVTKAPPAYFRLSVT